MTRREATRLGTRDGFRIPRGLALGFFVAALLVALSLLFIGVLGGHHATSDVIGGTHGDAAHGCESDLTHDHTVHDDGHNHSAHHGTHHAGADC